MAKKLNPDLTFIKSPSEIPVVTSPDENGNFFYFDESGSMKQSPMSTIYGLVEGVSGFLKISDPKPTVAGKYELIEIGSYVNLTPSNAPIVTKSGYLSTVYFDGTNFTFSEIEMPKQTYDVATTTTNGLMSAEDKTKTENLVINEVAGIADNDGNLSFAVNEDGYTRFVQLLSNLIYNLKRVGFEFNADGIVKIDALTEEQKNAITNISASFVAQNLNQFISADKKGNIGLKTDENGYTQFVQLITNLRYNLERVGFEFDESNNVKSQGAHWIKGKSVVSVGDSLSQSRTQWLDTFLNLSKAVYGGNFSTGGTRSIGPNGGMERLLNLKSSNIIPDVIFYENINDYWGVWTTAQKGAITDDSWMLSQLVDSVTVYNSATYAQNQTNLQTEINNIAVANRKVGTLLKMRYQTSSSKILTITAKATSNGTISLTVGGVGYSVAVTTDMTIAQIVAKIAEINYPDITLTSNATSVTFSSANTFDVIFTHASTGVVGNVTNGTSTINSTRKVFKSKNIADFTDVTKWVTESDLTMFAVYKGIIEFIQKNYPTTLLFWLIPTRIQLAYDPSNPNYKPAYWNTDVSFNQSAYTANFADYQNYVNLTNVQREVCEQYGVKYIDCPKLSGITPFNMSTFYNNFDLHPKQAGYDKWAETIYKNI